jgi:hypothetical protein
VVRHRGFFYVWPVEVRCEMMRLFLTRAGEGEEGEIKKRKGMTL